MATRRLMALIGAVALSLGSAVIEAGGWVVITLKTVPTHAWVGGQTRIYSVRQHGQTLLNDLNGHVEARKGSIVLRSTARPLVSTDGVRSNGAYVVDIPFSEPGLWTVDLTAGSGLVGDTLTMNITVLPQGAQEPAVSAADRGRRLFEGKGCVTCHTHPEFSGTRTVAMHDMTGKRYTQERVQAFLLSLPPRAANIESFGRMPNLGLAGQEIESLAAFLGR